MRCAAIEASPERDRLLDALALCVPAEGWTMAAAARAASDAGMDPRDAAILFPRGATELVEAWAGLVDRRMGEAAAAIDFSGRRTPERVRAVIAARLRLLRPHKEAVRRALGLLALPGHTPAAWRIAARTANAIWEAAGDSATGFAWYSKRASLAGVYAATLLAWLADAGEGDQATLAFLDRRLAAVGRIGSLRRRLGERLAGLRRGVPRSASGPAREG